MSTLRAEVRLIITALTTIPGWGRRSITRLWQDLHTDPARLVKWWRQPTRKYSVTATQVSAVKKFQAKWKLSEWENFLNHQTDFWLTFLDDEYPALLLETADPPLVLFGKGRVELLTQPALAVVGTRRCTPYGRLATSKIVSGLVSDGWTIISGGMYGIDEAAHRQALTSIGSTIAVIAQGFGAPMASQLVRLQTDILDAKGAVVTEYAPQTPAQKGTFVQRNRIIAGLSYGTVVIEAAAKSGSLITADCAAEAGRVVLAVPGPITSPFSEGTKSLINQGANLVSSPREVTALIKPQLRPSHTLLSKQLVVGNTVYQTTNLLESIRQMPTNSLELAARLGWNNLQTSLELQKLELEGHVYRDGEVWYAAQL